VADSSQALLESLRKLGWRVEPRSIPGPLLSPHQAVRYPVLPADLVAFLVSLETCCNRSQDAWFLTATDYAETSSETFRWNEFERISLESAAEDGDEERAKEVRAFWDAHFPFMMAVHSDYDYLAVQVGDGRFSRGSIVHGTGDDFEEPSLVAQSFDRFLALLKDAAEAPDPDYPFDVFLLETKN
jgi:hypothetical protein